MKKAKIIGITVIVLIILFLLMGPFFVVQEGELALVKRFDKIIRTEKEAGLKIKLPIIDKIIILPKKIQSWDGDSELLPTAEKQYIWVDATARWKISDPKLFFESVGTITNAQSRLDDVIDASVRRIIAKNSITEAVRNSNVINEIVRKSVFQTQASSQDEGPKDIELISTFTKVKYSKITVGREKLSDEMIKEALEETPKYGIDLIDIIIRQIKYSDILTQSVYDQMIKERNQIAQAFRSDGEGERAKWLGKMGKELLTIRSNAERRAKEIKAKADGKALDIRNRAYTKDANFADFWMAMVQYEKLLPKMKKLLTTDFEFFKFLYKKSGK